MNVDHFNGLTPAEAERIAVLIEEAAEVQQIACKILRHGYRSGNPDLIVNQGKQGVTLTNREMLEKEIGHLKSATHRLYAAGDIVKERVTYHERRKDDTGGRYMHHQPDAPEVLFVEAAMAAGPCPACGEHGPCKDATACMNQKIQYAPEPERE